MSNLLLNGKYQIKENKLFFIPFRSTQNIPHKLRIEGKWSLKNSSKLIFTVDSSYSDTFGETISFDVKVSKANSESLELLLLNRKTPTYRKIKRIVFRGSFKVFKDRFLSFEINENKKDGRDILIFNNKLEINKDNYLVYRYKTLSKEQSFILKGKWRFSNCFLIYEFLDAKKSLTFKVSLQRRRLKVLENRIYFNLGLEYDLKTSNKVSLWGKWRFRNKSEVEFILNRTKKSLFVLKLSKTFIKNRLLILSLDFGPDFGLGKLELELRLKKGVDNDYYIKLFKKGSNLGLYLGGCFRF